MVNEESKSQARPLLIFNYVVLLHLIILAIFFIQLGDTALGRKLTEKLTQNKLLQAVAAKITPPTPKTVTDTQKLATPPIASPKTTTISKAQLDQIKIEQDQHELKAANKISDDQVYFISHLVDLADADSEETKAVPEKTAANQKKILLRPDKHEHDQHESGPEKTVPDLKTDKSQTNQAAQVHMIPDHKPAVNQQPGPALTQDQATQSAQIPESQDITQTSAIIKKILELASTYLSEINPKTNLANPPSNSLDNVDTGNIAAQPNLTKTNQLPTTITEPAQIAPAEPVERSYSNHELAQLQKDLETKAKLLAEQEKQNQQKYQITQTELKQVKFKLDINSKIDQKLKYPDSQRVDRETIELPDTNNFNHQDINSKNNKSKLNSSNSKLAPADTSANNSNNNINISEHSNGPGRPVIRALAPGAYLRFANSNGQHIMSQAGRKTGQPSVQDLRKLSYNAMVMRTFSDAFNAFKLIFNMFVNEHTTIFVRFIIDPTGKVVHIDTHSDNAPPDVLEFIRKAITYANPFPPLPKHLAKDNYIFGPFAITFHPGRVAGQYVWTQSRG